MRTFGLAFDSSAAHCGEQISALLTIDPNDDAEALTTLQLKRSEPHEAGGQSAQAVEGATLQLGRVDLNLSAGALRPHDANSATKCSCDDDLRFGFQATCTHAETR